MNTEKKAGWVFLSLVPFIVAALAQILGGVFLTARFMVSAIVRNEMTLDEMMQMTDAETFEWIERLMSENLMTMLIQINLILLCIFGLWYFLWIIRGRQKGKLPAAEKIFGWKQVLALFLLAVGVSGLVTAYLGGLEFLAPSLIEEYAELMEETGAMTLASTVASLVMAPIVEELTFRGLTMEALKRTGWSFWIVNVMQAALFGILHMNLVQGSYAFALGLLLGYVGRRCGTLAAPVLLHMFCNFLGTYGTEFLNWALPLPAAAVYLLSLAVGAAVLFFGWKWFHKCTEIPAENGKIGEDA